MREFEACVLHDARAGQSGYTEIRRLRAADAQAAARALEAEQLRVLALTPVRARRRARRAFALPLFLQELLALLDAGLPVVEAIEALHDKAIGEPRRVLQTLRDALYQGRTLSQALGERADLFPELLRASVASSEHSGQLPQALQRYHHYEARLDTLRKRVRGALLYPAVVMTVGAAILVFLLGFVIPRFAAVFSGMDDLHGTARLLVVWGELVMRHGVLLALALLAGLAALIALLRTATVQRRCWRALWAIRYLRGPRLTFVLARFYRTLGLLLQGGTPVLEALRLTGALLPDEWRTVLPRVLTNVSEGRALSVTLQAHGLTTPVALRLLRVGERGGELAGMCERIARFHDDEIERAIDTFGKVFEPILMLVVGGVVGLVVFLLYMPIFELAGSLSP